MGSGGKAAGIVRLNALGLPTPRTWVLAHADGEWGRGAVKAAVAAVVAERVAYAVRSSADVEDAGVDSYAGQFESVLGVRGADAVADAALRVRAAAEAESVAAYSAARGAEGAVRMAVLVQEMVQPVMAGVAFSHDPVTGFATQIVEAVRGSGEHLVQHGDTPERWVRAWGAWRSTPDDPQLPEQAAALIAGDVSAAAEKLGSPVDVEWIWDGSRVVYVQLRPITGIGAVSFYSNRFSREVLPGIIVPLVWSINIPVVNGAWIRLLDSLVGETGLKPHDLAARFYCRAYFNMGALGVVFDSLGLPRETLELLGGIERTAGGERPHMRLTLQTLAKVPHASRFLVRAARWERFAAHEIAEVAADLLVLRPRIDAACAEGSGATPADLLGLIDELRPLVERVAYLNVVTPLASEAHNHLLGRRLAGAGIEFEQADFANRDPGDEGRDPVGALDRLHDEWSRLAPATRDAALAGDTSALAGAGATGFAEKLERFLAGYGHFSDSGNDFSYVPWREDVTAVLRMIDGHGASRAGAARLGRAEVVARAGGRVARAFDRASRFQVLRERVSSLYTLVYGLNRPLYRALGARLELDDGPLGDRVFHLSDGDVRALADGSLARGTAALRVAESLAEIERYRDAIVPEVVIGDEPGPLPRPGDGRLTGVGTSPGRHTGPAVVVASPMQAPAIGSGDVLVVPYSDVAWTPLFSRAGAIVAESGGFLSHTSIVAREFGIPAVVSVSDAMRLVPDGAIVSVDGYQGTVVVEATGGNDAEEVAS